MSYRTESPSTLDILALSRLSLFTRLDFEQFDHALSHFETREFRSGEIVLRKDQLNDCMYVVLEGQLSIHLREAENALVVLNKGESLGEMSIIGAQPVRALVKAAVPSRLVEITKENLWKLMDADPKFARALVQMFAKRLLNVTDAVPHDHHFQKKPQPDLHTDDTTGLYNRRWLNECLSDEMSRCAMRNRPLSVLAVDIDQFTSLQESWGQAIAEQALKAVSNAVQIALRALDMAIRYNDAKIIVVLPGANIFEGERLANRLHQAIQQITITDPHGRALPGITISVGISEMAEDEYAEILIARANAALQRATKNGGNCTSQ